MLSVYRKNAVSASIISEVKKDPQTRKRRPSLYKIQQGGADDVSKKLFCINGLGRYLVYLYRRLS
ncbi:MAG: hypothetical protein CVU91_03605 [Firmicutes bacterium HGW-Firmicutes-16]|nr:MAG: hypothetical protein CVU91_03605 [Firmicutes bacterium HGW-Firmicutes-16]